MSLRMPLTATPEQEVLAPLQADPVFASAPGAHRHRIQYLVPWREDAAARLPAFVWHDDRTKCHRIHFQSGKLTGAIAAYELTQVRRLYA